MAVFEFHAAGATEAGQKKALAYLLEQSSAGKAATGVLSGLAVTQTATASVSVNVAGGAGVVQAATSDGASVMVNDTNPFALDVLTANPVGGLPRNDIVVLDKATGSIRAIIGTPNASPTDPTVPTTAIPLARLRHAASATTIPTAKIDDLRVKVSLFGAADESNMINGVPFAGTSTAKAAKRIHWGSVAVNQSGGSATITHGAGFTPTVVHVTPNIAWMAAVTAITATTFTVALRDDSGAALTSTVTIYYACYE